MKALLCKSLDGPDALVIEDVPAAVAGAGEAVVRVRAVALNFFDTLMTRGKYQHRPPLPFSPGGELAGEVTSVGEGVHGLAVGQRVLAYTGWNGCREEIAIAAGDAVVLPHGIADEIAAAMPITYGTAIHGLEDRAKLKPGETLAVLGATGGAGLAAVELGANMGAHVIAAGTSDEKLKVCMTHGAQSAVNLTSGDLKENLRALTGGNGPHVIYDCIGGPYAEPALRSIAWGGRYLVIGFAAGDIPKVPLNIVLLKGCDIVGVFWGKHCEREPEESRRQIVQLLEWGAGGKLKPHIDHVFPLAETAKALHMIENREIKGKVIIRL